MNADLTGCDDPLHVPPSKHAKYASRNPISRYLVGSFLRSIRRIVVGLEFRSVLDVGCGEGMVLKSLEPDLEDTRCVAIDLDPDEVADARLRLPFCDVRVGSIYDLPFETGAFDLVICSEVLEHLDDPASALAELCRVSSRYCLVTVPREPLWRALNMCRGAYLADWGNTPDHVNHWSGRGFEAFVGSRLDVVQRAFPVPWTVLLAAQKNRPGR